MPPASPVREPLFTPRFLMLWAYAFITFFSAFQLLPAIPFRILQLGGSKAEAGWFLSAYTFASAFAAPLMGNVADHLGRRKLLVVASLLFIGFSFAYGVIRQLPLLLVVGAIHGAIWSAILSSASAIMSEFIPESRRTQGFAYWGLASTGAMAIAPATGLYIFRFGWATLCNELALLSIIMAVWALLLPVSHTPPPQSNGGMSQAWDWRVIRITLSLTVAAFGYGGMMTYAAILAIERHVTPPSIYLTVYAISLVIFRICFSHLGDRLGPKRMLYPSLVLVPIAFFILAGAHQRWQMILSAAIFGVGFGGAYPAFVSFVLEHTDSKRRARTFGSIVWAFDTGIGTGSLLVGAIGQRLGLGTAFAAAALLSCFSIPIFAWTSAHLADSAKPAST